MVHFLQGTEIGGIRLSTETVKKRIVILHRSGPLAGVHQIAGYMEGSAAEIAKEVEPFYVYQSPVTREKTHMEHYRTRPRLIEYRQGC